MEKMINFWYQKKYQNQQNSKYYTNFTKKSVIIIFQIKVYKTFDKSLSFLNGEQPEVFNMRKDKLYKFL